MQSTIVTSSVPQAASAAPAEQPRTSAGPLAKFFGVYLDPSTYGALFYMLISLVTGVVYFTVAVAGLSMSIGLLILVIGLPFAFLFMLAVRGMAVAEAGLVQAVLGVRIDTGPLFRQPGLTLVQRMKALVTDRRTWRSMLYQVLQLPVGVFNFTMTVTGLALSLGLMAIPAAVIFGDPQVLLISGQVLTIRPWVPTAIALVGFLLLTITLNAVRSSGRKHAEYAKSLLAD
ncbi:MAG TPA: sensor domain-containing protein [Anaerolineales bacterium]